MSTPTAGIRWAKIPKLVIQRRELPPEPPPRQCPLCGQECKAWQFSDAESRVCFLCSLHQRRGSKPRDLDNRVYGKGRPLAIVHDAWAALIALEDLANAR